MKQILTEQQKQDYNRICSMIDSCINEGDGYWIDNNYKYEFNGVAYELLIHDQVYDYLSKTNLKKVVKSILATGDHE